MPLMEDVASSNLRHSEPRSKGILKYNKQKKLNYFFNLFFYSSLKNS